MSGDEIDSFELINSGRTGAVICRRGRKRLALDWERLGGPGLDVCFSRVDLRHWDEPRTEPISALDQMEFLCKLRSWLKSQGIGSDIDLPKKVEFEDRRCIWAGCNEPRIKGLVMCMKHHNENVLVLEGIPRAEMKGRMRRSIEERKKE